MAEPVTPKQPKREARVPMTPFTPARTSAPASLTEEWERSQYVAFVSFINHVLKEDAVRSLKDDLRDGMVLYRLMESLKPGSMEGVRVRPARNEFQMLANCEAVVEGIREHVHLSNIGGRDLYEGNSMKLLLGMVWSIIYTLRISKGKDASQRDVTPKMHFLEQLQKATQAFEQVSTPHNLGADLRDGKALACLLHSFTGASPNLHLSPIDLLEEVQASFEMMGVPSVISAEDIASGTADEKALLLYLSYLEEVMQRKANEEQKELSSDMQLQKAQSMLPSLSQLSAADIKATFDNPALAELMLAMQSQLMVAQQVAEMKQSDVVRGPRTSMMRDMLGCGKLDQERRRSILRECAKTQSGLATFDANCNVCGCEMIGDADSCFSCGLKVHPLCMAGVKPILGHLLAMPLCALCNESNRVVPSRGWGCQPKEMVSKCVCGAEFGALRWKHTCRSCGSVRCDKCCGVKSMVPGFGTVQRVCRECQDEAPAPIGSLSRLSSILSPRFVMHQAHLVYELPHPSTCCVATDDQMYCASGSAVFVLDGKGVRELSFAGGTVEAMGIVGGKVLCGGPGGVGPLAGGDLFEGSKDVSALLGVENELLVGHPDGRLTRRAADGKLLGEQTFEGAVVALTPTHVGTIKGLWKRDDPTPISTKGVRALAEDSASNTVWSCSRTTPTIKLFHEGQFTTVQGEDRVRALALLTVNGERLVWAGDDGHISAWTLDEQPERRYHFELDGVVRGVCSPEEGEIWCVASSSVFRFKL